MLMLKKILFCIVLAFLPYNHSYATFFDPDIDIDFDNADLDRFEGWIQEFPSDVREQLEILFKNIITSQEYINERNIIFDKLSTQFQCANDVFFDGLNRATADTYLGRKKYSSSCIRQATGERARLIGGQSFNLPQRYALELCTLNEFVDDNKNENNFILLALRKSQTIKDVGAVLKCSTNTVKKPLTYFINASEYFNAYDYLRNNDYSCNSQRGCTIKLLETGQEKLNKFSSLWPNSGLITKYREKLAEINNNLDRDGYQLLSLYESYNFIRSIDISNKKIKNVNTLLKNNMTKACNIANRRNITQQIKNNTDPLFGANKLLIKTHDQYNNGISKYGNGVFTSENKTYYDLFFSKIKKYYTGPEVCHPYKVSYFVNCKGKTIKYDVIGPARTYRECD